MESGGARVRVCDGSASTSATIMGDDVLVNHDGASIFYSFLNSVLRQVLVMLSLYCTDSLYPMEILAL
jgi:hypothetical protein